MFISPILNISSKLVLPILFSLSKQRSVAYLHLLYQDNGNVLIAASSPTPIMLAKASKLLFDLLLVVAVPLLEGSHRLAHVLPPTPGAGTQVQDIWTVTGHVLLDEVPFVCVAAGEALGLLDDGTRHSTVITFVATRISYFNNTPLLTACCQLF